ncbi:protein of unknown function [Methylacidimicrobium sp. AP8]|uniref:hypothetical protein n=1 Tax=Methylacidimicrobium sp. AP8 TaxID=2730359 RepID=UPI0018C0D09D|nr:hypothetical protein [Methylacidimicrobium sp. AP8]CAB4244497.1 protein of unknown function [Methylacidimicrobium sp. AP8]
MARTPFLAIPQWQIRPLHPLPTAKSQKLLPWLLVDYKESDRLILNTNFMYSNFRFANDPVYHQNRLPLFPINYLQAQLMYQHPSGFYIGPNVEASITPYPVDYANTLDVPA